MVRLTTHEFWTQLLHTVSGFLPQELIRTVQPTPPVNLIQGTVCQGPILAQQRSSLNIAKLTLPREMTTSQRLACELAVSNSPVYLISGAPASGKTTIAKICASAAVDQNKKVLLVSRFDQTLTAYQDLPGYPYRLSWGRDYQTWLGQKIRQENLGDLRMDFLPLYLLQDPILAQLRTSAKLETWISHWETLTESEWLPLLAAEFPGLSPHRLQLLALRLKQLQPLLQQQHILNQQAKLISDESLTELSDQLLDHPQIPILATMAELWTHPHRWLHQTNFDLVIVEDAHWLTWVDLMLVAGRGQKLILLGDHLLWGRSRYSTQQSFLSRYPHPFAYLSDHLLPNYRCNLASQFRLQPDLARPIYAALSDRWISTPKPRPHRPVFTLPNSLLWQMTTEKYHTSIVTSLLNQLRDAGVGGIGCLCLCPHSLPQWQQNLDIPVGTIETWAGKECQVLLLLANGDPNSVNLPSVNLALTRAQDYLIGIGDANRWSEPGSVLRSLFNQPDLMMERQVVFA